MGRIPLIISQHLYHPLIQGMTRETAHLGLSGWHRPQGMQQWMPLASSRQEHIQQPRIDGKLDGDGDGWPHLGHNSDGQAGEEMEFEKWQQHDGGPGHPSRIYQHEPPHKGPSSGNQHLVGPPLRSSMPVKILSAQVSLYMGRKPSSYYSGCVLTVFPCNYVLQDASQQAMLGVSSQAATLKEIQDAADSMVSTYLYGEARNPLVLILL